MKENKSNKSIASKIFTMVLRSWWVILFMLICIIGYDMGIKKRKVAIIEMKAKYNNLLAQKNQDAAKKEDLSLKLLSQSDPSWIEQVLMKELGVVPENKIKVHFKN
ncbi:MAG: hypothetical protein KR126chlam5_01061 [Candidatus Anoxychlamydiales bacterium]|nr:hypothetical protein [Candidatus Anoxychlamydiales bacterium]NGX52757.1 hypothetical protein [Candidatus Anoxychlamydiales bacterium]